MTLSPIVAGTWRMASWGWNAPTRQRWIEQCVALGVTSFDHANIYGGYTVEALFGEALAAAPGLRERIQLVTKCGIRPVSAAPPGRMIKSYDSSRAHMVASVEQSLRSLRTDRIDVLLIHRPDGLMDPDELAETFHALRSQGKVLDFGVSNHTPSQFALLHRRIALVTNQIEFSPLQLAPLHDGSLDQCVDLELRPMIWSPLAGGRSAPRRMPRSVCGPSCRLWLRSMAWRRPRWPSPGCCAIRAPIADHRIVAHRGDRRGSGRAAIATRRAGVVPHLERRHRPRRGLNAALVRRKHNAPVCFGIRRTRCLPAVTSA